MPFHVLLGDALAALFAPVIEFLAGLVAALFGFLADLLAPILAPIFAPILELIAMAFALVAGAFTALVWGLMTALGCARYARGISRVSYLLSGLAFLYLLVGLLMLFAGNPDTSPDGWYSETTVIGAIIFSVLGLAAGAAAANDPNRPKVEETPTETDAPIRSTESMTRLSPWFAGFITAVIVVAGVMLLTREPALPECTTEQKLRNAAAELLAERGKPATADLVAVENCRN